MSDTEIDDMFAEFAKQTAQIRWAELAKHFARGVVVVVSPELDVVKVARDMAQDDKSALEGPISSGAIRRANDDDARYWNANDPELWAVVVAPWVLVQARV